MFLLNFQRDNLFVNLLQAEGPPVQVEPVDLSIGSPRGKLIFIFLRPRASYFILLYKTNL